MHEETRTGLRRDIRRFGDQFGNVDDVVLVKVAWVLDVHVLFHNHVWPIEVDTVPPVKNDKKP